MSAVSMSYIIEQVGERWACLAGNLTLLCDSKEEAEALRERLIAAAIRQKELDRKRRLIA